MQYECKITVLDTKVFPELQEKYLANPKSGKCPFFNVGDTFVLKRTAEQDDFYHLIRYSPYSILFYIINLKYINCTPIYIDISYRMVL